MIQHCKKGKCKPDITLPVSYSLLPNLACFKWCKFTDYHIASLHISRSNMKNQRCADNKCTCTEAYSRWLSKCIELIRLQWSCRPPKYYMRWFVLLFPFKVTRLYSLLKSWIWRWTLWIRRSYTSGIVKPNDYKAILKVRLMREGLWYTRKYSSFYLWNVIYHCYIDIVNVNIGFVETIR